MQTCGNCGAETSRIRTTFDEHGEPVRDACPQCAPELFSDPFITPADQKLWPGPAALPNQYKQDADGVYRPKDELLQDTYDLWDKGPTEEKKEEKRRNRRTEAMTPEERERAIRWGNEVLAPFLRDRGVTE